MERKLYTIGKAARLMGIQAQLLRYYCDKGLVRPEYIDPASGYRYFSYEQFPYIDRIRFLLRCGISLKDIKNVLDHDDIQLLTQLLNQKKEEKVQELKRVQDSLQMINWYIDYFAHGSLARPDGPYQVKHIKARYFLAAKCPDNYDPTGFYDLFSEIKNRGYYRELQLTRQVTVILDYEALLRRIFKRYYVGAFILEPPAFRSEHILELPEGDYYCFHADIHSDLWDPKQIGIPLVDKGTPRLVLASEYEVSFTRYNNNPHEVQILF